MKRRMRCLSRSWSRLLGLCLLIMAIALLLVPVAHADDCLTDPTNLQDCMRTGTYRQVVTIISVLLGVSPVVLAGVLGLTPDQIRTLIQRDFWNPNVESWQLDRFLRGAGPRPTFPNLPGPAIAPGRTPVDRIYDGPRAETILRGLGIWDNLKALNPEAPQYRMQLDMLLQREVAHRHVKGIALDWKQKIGPDGKPVVGKDGKPVYLRDKSGNPILNEDGVVIVVEEPEYPLP